jgi:hypothetical protein
MAFSFARIRTSFTVTQREKLSSREILHLLYWLGGRGRMIIEPVSNPIRG